MVLDLGGWILGLDLGTGSGHWILVLDLVIGFGDWMIDVEVEVRC